VGAESGTEYAGQKEGLLAGQSDHTRWGRRGVSCARSFSAGLGHWEVAHRT